jgi:hypothetical protein
MSLRKACFARLLPVATGECTHAHTIKLTSGVNTGAAPSGSYTTYS